MNELVDDDRLLHWTVAFNNATAASALLDRGAQQYPNVDGLFDFLRFISVFSPIFSSQNSFSIKTFFRLFFLKLIFSSVFRKKRRFKNV